jgi:hypothetical protein
LIDKFGNQIFRTSSYANFAQKMVPAGGKVRGVLTKFGSDYQLLAVPKRCGDYCAKLSPFFLPRFPPWLIKRVFQDGQISFRVAKPSGKGLCIQERIC